MQVVIQIYSYFWYLWYLLGTIIYSVQLLIQYKSTELFIQYKKESSNSYFEIKGVEIQFMLEHLPRVYKILGLILST